MCWVFCCRRELEEEKLTQVAEKSEQWHEIRSRIALIDQEIEEKKWECERTSVASFVVMSMEFIYCWKALSLSFKIEKRYVKTCLNDFPVISLLNHSELNLFNS